MLHIRLLCADKNILLTYFITNHHQVNLALHPSGVDKSGTSFSRGKGGKVTAEEWQVTLCDPM